MLGAARLSAAAYEEVEADPRSLPGAALVVLVAGASGGLGTWLRQAAAGAAGLDLGLETAASALLAPVLWLAGSAFAFMAGASFFRGPHTQTDFAEVLRTTGFAFAPGWLFAAQGLRPEALGIVAGWLLWLWVLAGGVVALRQALDFGTLRALGTFAAAATLLWLVIWGLGVVPLPLPLPR
jgi:hypothetical protein